MAEIKEIRPLESTFQPYVTAEDTRKELTPRALILGAFFGLLFGAVTVYVGLRAGLTVSASIPIAVLSISILRVLGRSTILENNIVQTTGSAGESIAGGVIFTIPALIFLGFDMEKIRIFMLALLGGWLGVFFMIPLRRQLIVKEHGNLAFPEGTACADVLIAGDRGGSFASRVFAGLGIGALYTFFQNENMLGAWNSTPAYDPNWLKGGSLRANTTSEYLGVGYIIGPRIAGVIFAGGVFAWLVVMPTIHFFGNALTQPLYPGTKLISDMTPDDLWRTYIRPIGAGAVAAAGLITLVKTMPTIIAALRAGAKDLGQGASAALTTRRTELDLDIKIALGGVVALVIAIVAMLKLHPVPGAQTSLIADIAAAIFVVIFGFLFVAVSSRICGLIGTSSNPISGMAIATLMAVCAVFLVLGWTAPAFSALAITIGGIVCIAAANAGNTSQDLKTGFLVGATPRNQQIALLVGVLVSVFAIGFTLEGMNRGLEQFKAMPPRTYDLQHLPQGVQVQQNSARDLTQEHEIRVTADTGKGDANSAAATETKVDGANYVLLNALGSPELPDGKYLYNKKSGAVDIQWIQGIGSERAAAPQARLMATVISGILNRRLPWGLVLLGVFIVISVELLGIRSLSFAVGFYLSIATTLAIFCGGIVRWLVERSAAKAGQHMDESDVSPGSLFASGLIAAGGIVGLLGIAIKLIENAGWMKEGAIVLHIFKEGSRSADIAGVVTFGALMYALYHFALKPLDTATARKS